MFQLKSIVKTLVNVPGNILFCITLMKIIGFVAKESIKSKLFTTNYAKKRRFVSLVQRAKGFLVRMARRKKT